MMTPTSLLLTVPECSGTPHKQGPIKPDGSDIVAEKSYHLKTLKTTGYNASMSFMGAPPHAITLPRCMHGTNERHAAKTRIERRETSVGGNAKRKYEPTSTLLVTKDKSTTTSFSVMTRWS